MKTHSRSKIVLNEGVGTLFECVAILATPEQHEIPVAFDDAYAPRHPRRSQLAHRVCKRTVDVFARHVQIVPTQPGFPMKTFGLVVSLLTTSKARDLRPQSWHVRHALLHLFRVCDDADHLPLCWNVDHDFYCLSQFRLVDLNYDACIFFVRLGRCCEGC